MVAIHPVQEFNGAKYYRKPSGYYKAQYDPSVGTRYMHRDVWEFYNGPIPDGHHIHHTDGDRANNRIENLECVCKHEHAKHHMAQRPEGWWEESLSKARAAAPAWHGSEEGLAWHKAHAKATGFGVMDPEERTCVWCGKTYVGDRRKAKRGFCSASCQGMARKASGVDDVDVVCKVCGATFRSNKYTPRKTCSKACSNRAVSLARTRVQPDGS